MAKRGSRRGKPNQIRIAQKKIYQSLYEVDKMLESGRYVEARNELQQLDQQFPDNEDVLRELVNACYELNDSAGYQYAIERFSKIMPDDPDVFLGLAGAYMSNLRMTLALRGFHHFLERWPEHERAAEVRQRIEHLKPMVHDRLRKLGFTEEEYDELGALHDESQILMEYGQYAEGRRVAEELIARKPRFAAVRNNLSLMWAMEGNLGKAITVAQETLEIEPDNYHTLANLIHFHVQNGQIEQASQYADRLKSVVDEEMVDIWEKKIEALSYLGDDAGVIAVFNQAQEFRNGEALKFMPLIFHFAAVAEMRLGNDKQARSLWRQALKIYPGLELARDNLDDLSKHTAERHAPWPFPLASWIPKRTLNNLIASIKSINQNDNDQAINAAMCCYIDQNPELAPLVPILLERGDPAGRGLAMQLATSAKTPEMMAALRDFALSHNGPDQMRLQAAQTAREEKLLPEGTLRLWIKGKWTEVTQTYNEIHYEPLFEHRPDVRELMAKGIDFMRKEDGVNSERFFKQALELEPEAPDILNNLALAYNLQGRNEEGERIMRQIHRQHPDYLFGIINMARIHIYHGELDKAADLLKPLLSRKRLHHDELIALIEANINLYLAKEDPDRARQWIKMWENVDPDDPKLQNWRQKIEMQDIPEIIRRNFSFKSPL
jgi:tetratricopeptide (TPR) repeat protein